MLKWLLTPTKRCQCSFLLLGNKAKKLINAQTETVFLAMHLKIKKRNCESRIFN